MTPEMFACPLPRRTWLLGRYICPGCGKKYRKFWGWLVHWSDAHKGVRP